MAVGYYSDMTKTVKRGPCEPDHAFDNRVLILVQAGLGVRAIARALLRDPKTINHRIKRLRKTGKLMG